VSNDLKKQIEDKGYVIVRGLIKKEDIDKYREVLIKHFNNCDIYAGFGKTQPNAAVMIEGLENLFSNKKIIEIFKKLFGTNEIIFTRHADAHYNMLSGWHRDSGEKVIDKGYFNVNDASKNLDCKVYKAAVYLQKQNIKKRGFTLIEGSHKTSTINKDNIKYLNCDAGDVIFFDCRIYHSGQFKDYFEKGLEIIIKKIFPSNFEKIGYFIKEIYWKLVRKKDRQSIFFTFGFPNAYTKEFSKRNMIRQIEQSGLVNMKLPKKLKSRLEGQGVSIASMDNLIV